MQTIPLIASWREAALIAGVAVAVLLFLWFVARLSHRPYLVLDDSESMRVALAQMGRLADTLERLAQSVDKLENRIRVGDNQTPPVEEAHRAMSGMNLSMFGR